MVSLLLTAPAKKASAQGAGGYWKCYFTTSGAFDGSSTYSGAAPQTFHNDVSGVWPWDHGRAYCQAIPGFNVDSSTAYTSAVQVTAHLKCVWTANGYGYYGPATPPPPPTLTLLYSSDATWSAHSNVSGQDISLIAHGADDGFSDSETTWGTYSGQALGGHLKTYQSGSGVVEDDVPLNAHVQIYTPVNVNASGGIGFSLTALQDTRGVNVTSSADYTFHRGTDASGAFVPVANLPDSGGAIHGDMKAAPPPDDISVPTISITYKAATSGNWAANSTYHWFDSKSGYSDSGTFDSGTPPQPFRCSFRAVRPRPVPQPTAL